MKWARLARLLGLAAVTGTGATFGCNLPTSPNGSGSSATTTGTCSGQPVSCAGLSGADCARAAGCQDTGSCTGVAANIGEACGAQASFVSCTNTSGCFWQANCGGEVFGSCSGVTEAQCTAVPGCIWTPFAGSGGATSTTCATYQMGCTVDSDCDCGFRCTVLCSSCAKGCVHPCQTSTDCSGTTGSFGQSTPNCSKQGTIAASAGFCSP